MQQENSLLSASKLKRARFFNKLSGWITRKAGSPVVAMSAFAIVLLWALSGPIFNFSDTWQLVINTGTTIITFLMVFIIQQSQNKDTAAIHTKLNELIASNEKASNRLIDIEDLTDEEIQVLKKFYIKLADKAEKEMDLHSSHSLDEAEDNHQLKLRRRRKESKPG
jgi:low affinity Fe/Cu permease